MVMQSQLPFTDNSVEAKQKVKKNNNKKITLVFNRSSSLLSGQD